MRSLVLCLALSFGSCQLLENLTSSVETADDVLSAAEFALAIDELLTQFEDGTITKLELISGIRAALAKARDQ